MTLETRYIVFTVLLCLAAAIIVGVLITAAVIGRKHGRSRAVFFLVCMAPALCFALFAGGLASMGQDWAKQDIVYAHQQKLTARK